MTIHDTHPFASDDPDQARRFRGRLGGAVTLWTSGGTSGGTDTDGERSGLTVTSQLVALGEPARLLALVDPESDLLDTLTLTGRAVVQLLGWVDRDLAEMFAGTAPAPGGMFAAASFVATDWGPLLERATTWVGVALESTSEVGWSQLVTATVQEVHLGEDHEPLVHRRGRWQRRGGPDD